MSLIVYNPIYGFFEAVTYRILLLRVKSRQRILCREIFILVYRKAVRTSSVFRLSSRGISTIRVYPGLASKKEA